MPTPRKISGVSPSARKTVPIRIPNEVTPPPRASVTTTIAAPKPVMITEKRRVTPRYTSSGAGVGMRPILGASSDPEALSDAVDTFRARRDDHPRGTLRQDGPQRLRDHRLAVQVAE